jgi:hypothetical protein
LGIAVAATARRELVRPCVTADGAMSRNKDQELGNIGHNTDGMMDQTGFFSLAWTFLEEMDWAKMF